MGVFTRLRDIVNANINSMLEKAEDPEKLVKLMINEMEETLVEIKASCAQSIANRKRVVAERDAVRVRTEEWEKRARLAVDKGREDLAREALVEKRRFTERGDRLDEEIVEFDAVVEQYREQIGQLEEKLAAAREKQRILVERHRQAGQRKRAQTDIRRMETSDVMSRFDDFQNRIDRMEAEADLVNAHRQPSLEEAFRELEGDDDIEKELEQMKSEQRGGEATV